MPSRPNSRDLDVDVDVNPNDEHNVHDDDDRDDHDDRQIAAHSELHGNGKVPVLPELEEELDPLGHHKSSSITNLPMMDDTAYSQKMNVRPQQQQQHQQPTVSAVVDFGFESAQKLGQIPDLPPESAPSKKVWNGTESMNFLSEIFKIFGKC